LDPVTRVPDFDDASLTENTRAAYPLDFIPDRFRGESAAAPKNVFFLSADAFGVLPPLSRLTEQQALFYFLSGYTSKLSGTEEGLSTQPEATFSTCFAAPFLPLKPQFYSDLFASLLHTQRPSIWLVNTGWLGGTPDRVPRISLPVTRNLIHAALTGELEHTPMRVVEGLGLSIPTECPGIPAEMLDPAANWESQEAYTQTSAKLTQAFRSNFEQLGVDPRLSIF
jgi:phosphoenolpyruvate carboxykinase (ATP)